MADTKIDIKIEAVKLGKDIEKLGKTLVSQLQEQIRVFSKTVYNEGLRLSSERLKTSQEMFNNNLKYEKIGDNTYVIYLIDDSPAIHFEEGWGSFDMKPGFLNSSKAKKTKDGKSTFFDVPFKIEPHSKSPAGKGIIDMRSAVASVLKDEQVTKTITEFNEGATGLAKYGTVTRYTNTGDPRTEGLVQIQSPTTNSSSYFLFRRVSKNSPSHKFNHPGFKGAKIFPDLETYAQKGVEEILKKFLG